MWIGGVRALIFNDKKEMLMVRQEHEGRDLWLVPGGGIEQGETSEQALVREIREETGLIIEPERLIWHIEEVSEERGMRFVNFFLARLKSGTLQLGHDPEFDDSGQVLREVRFVSRKEIMQFERVYPAELKNEIWGILEQSEWHQPYKIRLARMD